MVFRPNVELYKEQILGLASNFLNYRLFHLNQFFNILDESVKLDITLGGVSRYGETLLTFTNIVTMTGSMSTG